MKMNVESINRGCLFFITSLLVLLSLCFKCNASAKIRKKKYRKFNNAARSKPLPGLMFIISLLIILFMTKDMMKYEALSNRIEYFLRAFAGRSAFTRITESLERHAILALCLNLKHMNLDCSRRM
jgi:hypothetical protein